MKNIPKIGQIYNCFDDGKISHSRLYHVTIKDLIPFNKIDSITLENWQNVVEVCDWLFAEKTDYFITTEDTEDIFVRTKDGGWFSIGSFLNSGRLDVDGELTHRLIFKE